MCEFLRNIDVISGLSFIVAAASAIYTIKHNERLNEYQEWHKDFEQYKDVHNREHNLIQNLLSEKNIRASIMPYFNIVLKNNRIKREKDSLILEIGFINIGKESATNIGLSLKYPDKGVAGYLDSEYFPKKQYFVCEYLSKYYAAAREEVTFKVRVKLENEEEISDFLKFKIKYYDLVGNQYEQEFRFGFYMSFNIGYNLNNTSYKPILLENKTILMEQQERSR